MITPITDEHAVIAMAKRVIVPSLTIAGIRILPHPAASAVEDPEMPGEQHGNRDIHMAQAPGQPACQHAGQINQFGCDLAGVHQVGSQQEERHSKQDEGVIRLEHPVQDDEGGQPDIQHDHRDCCNAKRKGHRAHG